MTSGRRCAIRSMTAGDDDVEPVEREPAIGQRRARRRGCRASRSRGRRRRRPAILGEQAVDECRADEPRAARHQCLACRRTLAYVGRVGGHATAARWLPCPITVTPAPMIVSAVERDVRLRAPRPRPTTESCTPPPCDDADARRAAPRGRARRRLRRRRRGADDRAHERAHPPRCVRPSPMQHRRLDLGARHRRRRRPASRRRARPRARRARAGAPSRPASTSACACEVLLGRPDVEPVAVGSGSRTAARAARASAGTSRARPTR